MSKLYWEAKAYDEAGNLVILVHNPEVAHLLQWAEEERILNKNRPKDKQVELPRETPLVELATQNELFDMAVQEGLTEEAVKILWGVMPGDMRLRKPLTDEEKQAERAAFREMLKEAQERLYWNHKGTDGVAERHNEKLRAGKPSTTTKRTGAKKEKVVKEKATPIIVEDGVW